MTFRYRNSLLYDTMTAETPFMEIMEPSEISSGSLKQLWKVSSSLMISFLSMVAMMFADRLYLSYYSADALSAATSAGTLFWAGSFMCVTLVSMAEVFVAQYNGSKQYQKLGKPVWQMIYFSLFSFIFFIFLSTYVTNLLLKTGVMNASEGEYYAWNNYFAPFLTLQTAISAFFIGQGKMRVIKWLGLIGNGINVILDPILIFGKCGFPAMGIKGAAIATGIGVIVQLVIIASMFLSKSNHEKFRTRDWKFDNPLFLKCLRIGLPSALFVLFELLGWSIFYIMMEKISAKHILIASINQSILLLFLFFGLGLEKGAAAIAGNLIGGKLHKEVTRLFWSGLKLSIVFGAVLAIFLGFFSDQFINLFFMNPDAISSSSLAMTPELLFEVKVIFKYAIFNLVLYLVLDNIRWLLSGLLTAAGDTLLPMFLGLISIWCFMLVPTYLFVYIPKAPIERALLVWVFYSFTGVALFLIRFFRGKWKEKHILDEKERLLSPP